MAKLTPGDVQWPVIDSSTFKPGTVPLRAVLVDIDTAKPLGGFETTATSSDMVLVSDDDKAKVFVDDKQRWPGAKTPLDWGYGYY